MNKTDLTNRVLTLARDFSGALFREADIHFFLNEGIDRVSQVINQLEGMTHLVLGEDNPILMPSKWHHLLAIYATARCFAQDDRHFQSGNYMNEFEMKLQELDAKIQSGEIVIADPVTGEPIEFEWQEDYVKDIYFKKSWE